MATEPLTQEMVDEAFAVWEEGSQGRLSHRDAFAAGIIYASYIISSRMADPSVLMRNDSTLQ